MERPSGGVEQRAGFGFLPFIVHTSEQAAFHHRTLRRSLLLLQCVAAAFYEGFFFFAEPFRRLIWCHTLHTQFTSKLC